MSNNMITAATHSYEKADVLKNKLELAGIDCFLKNINLIQGSFSGGVKVMVHEKDLEEALKVIEEATERIFSKIDKKEKPCILVPIDFSDFSLTSCKFAFQIADKINARVDILHVFFSPAESSIPFSELIAYDRHFSFNVKELESKALDNMKEFKEKIDYEIGLRNLPNIEYSTTIIEGIPEDRILQEAKKHVPKAIVMGTHGATGSQHDLLGSVTAEIIDRAKVPVLAIPHSTKLQSIYDVKNIGYTTNFDQSELIATDKLMSLFENFDIWIQYIHVGHSNEEPWDEVKLKGMRKFISDKYDYPKIECRFIEGDELVNTLDEYIDDYAIDIVAITTHRRSIIHRLFNPSKARKMLFHSHTPLLVFHANKH